MTPPDNAAKVLYTAKSHTTSGGREGGTSRTDDGHLDVKLTMPGHGDGTNPEQLFAVGWSACFTSAMKIVAAQKHIRLGEGVALDAEVDLVQSDDGYSLRARLNATLPGVAIAAAQEIMEGAHQICPYSKATRGNIPVELNVV